MTYATQQDLADRFGLDKLIELTDRVEPYTGMVDEIRVTTALTDASEVINGYVAGRYAVPLTPVTGQIKRWACDIAWFFLWQDPKENIRNAYLDAKKDLEAVRAGRLTLDAAGTAAAPAVNSASEVFFSASERLFTSRGLEGF